MENQTTTIVNEEPDSIEIGTPSKGGCIKIYGNFRILDSFKIKLENAKKIREEAQKLLA